MPEINPEETKEQAELEAGREKGRQLYREAITLFDNPPEGARVKTREEADLLCVSGQEDDRLLVREVMFPGENERVNASIYLAAKGANPGGICIIEGGRSITGWLLPNGAVSEAGGETISSLAEREEGERNIMQEWLEAFKS